MTPKAQQIGSYEMPGDLKSQYAANKKHKRGASSASNLSSSSGISDFGVCSNQGSELHLGLWSRVTNAVNPSFIFLVATPIAMQYPLIQFIAFFTLLIGISPLYFIMITFSSKSK